jgi:small subunit ribosomal protein S3
MGHKVHPTIHRTQVIYTWDSRWFGKRGLYQRFVKDDVRIREYLREKFKEALIDSISVERGPKQVTITMLAAKPGFIIGRGGSGLDDVRKHIERKFLNMSLKVKINVQEVRNPSLSAHIVARTAVMDIEKRMPFRRVMKQTIERVMKAGAQGVKISMNGRLNGVEIARSEKLAAGTVPLITMRSDVDYAADEAQTMYGKIGVKVWVCRGEVFGRKDKFAEAQADSSAPRGGNRRGGPRDRAPHNS